MTLMIFHVFQDPVKQIVELLFQVMDTDNSSKFIFKSLVANYCIILPLQPN